MLFTKIIGVLPTVPRVLLLVSLHATSPHHCVLDQPHWCPDETVPVIKAVLLSSDGQNGIHRGVTQFCGYLL